MSVRWLVDYFSIAVSLALRDVYLELTGKDIRMKLIRGEVPGDILTIAEFVCRRMGLDYSSFERFFNRTKEDAKISEEELMRISNHAEKLLTDLGFLKAAGLTRIFSPQDEGGQLQWHIEAHLVCEKLCANQLFKEIWGSLPTQEKRKEYIRRIAQKIATDYRITDTEQVIQTLKEIIKNRGEGGEHGMG